MIRHGQEGDADEGDGGGDGVRCGYPARPHSSSSCRSSRRMPFRYASLNSFWLFYAVRRESVEALLPDLPAGHGVCVLPTSPSSTARARSLDFQA